MEMQGSLGSHAPLGRAHGGLWGERTRSVPVHRPRALLQSRQALRGTQRHGAAWNACRTPLLRAKPQPRCKVKGGVRGALQDPALRCVAAPQKILSSQKASLLVPY
jgi:hypothetical protein